MTDQDKAKESDRGKRASFDPQSGEVHGSGSGAGANSGSDEDHDGDPMAGGGSDAVGGPRRIDEAIQRPTDPDEGI